MKNFFILVTVICVTASLSAETEKLDPQNAIKLMQEGNARFLKGEVQHPNQSIERRRNTFEQGQKPYATVLSCSDSRVPPELIFDAGIGDLFVIRVAGNVVDTDEIGSIEYGAGHLSTPLMIVLGHMKCGAVTAVVKGDHVGGSIPQLVSKINPAARQIMVPGVEIKDENIDKVIRANVFQSIADLIRRSPEIRERVKSGSLKIVGAYYRIDNGQVEWLGEHPGQARLMESAEEFAGPGSSVRYLIQLNGALVLSLALVFFLLVRENRPFKFFRITGRVVSSFLAIVSGTSVAFFFLPSDLPAELKSVALASTALIATVFSILYVKSILSSMKKSIDAYKMRITS